METEETTKYYRTEFKLVILSQHEPMDNCALETLAYEMTEGDCSGVFTLEGVKELTPAEAAQALLEQGSDPDFFGLNEDGTPLDEGE